MSVKYDSVMSGGIMAVQTRYLNCEGGKIAYSDYGSTGQAVVMIPGMGALRSEYRYLTPKLSEAGFRGVTLDIRGHGESSVPSVGSDILTLIDHLSVGAAHLVGTSKSAGAVVWAATELPKSVRSVVLISPFVHQVKVNPIMKSLFWIMMHNPWKVQAWVSYYNTLYPTFKPEDFQVYLSQLRNNLSEPGRMKAVNAYGNASLKDVETRLRRLKVPTLVVMGTKDPDFPEPVSEARGVAKDTGGVIELIEGAGHYPQTEMPEKTNPIIVDFLKRYM
jgi:pimeloyl-ACP methyl ester carboxylesterase